MTDNKPLDLDTVVDIFKGQADDWLFKSVDISNPPVEAPFLDGWAEFEPGPVRTITVVLLRKSMVSE